MRAQFDKLVAAPGLVRNMVPEMIRWQTPLSYMRRTATRDCELGGKPIRKHDQLLMWYVSGNRDEEIFENANALDIERKNARVHLSFGHGTHFCMGSRLAELQLRVLWEEILQRFERIEVREEPFRGKRVRVFQIPASAREPDDKIVLPDLQNSDSHELLIGIRAPSHIYLNVGPHRFDGNIFRPLRVRERGYAYPGIVIRLVDVPVKSLNAVRRQLEELSGREYRTLTCANSACRVIARAANIEIDDHADMRPFLPSHVLPTRTIRKVIERGVRSHEGDLIETQIYKTDDRSLEEILAEMRREEIRIARDHLEMWTLGVWRVGASHTRKLWRRVRGRPERS